MNILKTKYIRLAILLLFISGGVSSVNAQDNHTKFNIGFRAESNIIDPAYSKNAATIEQIFSFLENAGKDSSINIVKVSFYGAASPEGSYRLNYSLAKKRSEAIEQLVRNKIDIPESIIVRNSDYIQWEYLKELVKDSQLDSKDEVLSILNEEANLVDYYYPYSKIDSRILKLMQLKRGKVWKQMGRLFFRKLRNAGSVFVTCRKRLPELNIPDIALDVPQASAATVPTLVHPKYLDPKYNRTDSIQNSGSSSINLHVKSNAVGLGMAIANIAAEVGFAKHWSASVPVYYSAWNYCKSTIKLRTFAIQPEVRYWFSDKHNGIFAGIHLGLAYYNIALNGRYRFQDQGENSPAIGGGINIGYRLPISKNNRWSVEFALGAGVYNLRYDMFHNTPDTKDGLLVRSTRKTCFGLDQAAISFAYMFDLRKKGGK